MALSTAQIRAIAIKRKIAKKVATTTAPQAANDNIERRSVRRPRAAKPKGLLQACIDAGGFDQNANYAS